VIGLQFHLETTVESAERLIQNCRELMRSTYVQTEEELSTAPAAAYDTINRLMARVLAYLTEQS
jgi:hypothetical protein